MRKVIVNSTPIIALYKVGQLELLKSMYGEIIIPEAVFREVTAKNDGVEKQISDAPWIHIQAVSNSADRLMYQAKLHEGEVEVMILAQEIGAEIVVIDDNAARKTAEYLGIPLTGTMGVLIKAKQVGVLESVMPIIDAMLAKGIFLSDGLISAVRKIVGE